MTRAGGRPDRSLVKGVAALAALALVLVALPVGIAAAGLAGGGSTGGGGGGPAPVLTVHLTARYSRFTPAAVDVPAGSTVRFVIENRDPIDHEFIVGPRETHQRHEVGREAHHHGDVSGEISAPAGETVSTTWTAPTTPGPVTFACHLPGHLAYGMTGVVNLVLE